MHTKIVELLSKIRTKTLKQICMVFASTHAPDVDQIKEQLDCNLRTAYDYYYACLFLRDVFRESLDWKTLEETESSSIAPTLTTADKSEIEFAKRFTATFQNHIQQLVKKDLSIIISHMSEEHDCGRCVMREVCNKFLESYLFALPQLPICMQRKIGLPNTIKQLDYARK